MCKIPFLGTQRPLLCDFCLTEFANAPDIENRGLGTRICFIWWCPPCNRRSSRELFSGGTRNFVCGGEHRGGKMRSSEGGEVSKKLPKMADFCHFFPFWQGGQVGGQSLRRGGQRPHPPVDAPRGCRHWNY